MVLECYLNKNRKRDGLFKELEKMCLNEKELVKNIKRKTKVLASEYLLLSVIMDRSWVLGSEV